MAGLVVLSSVFLIFGSLTFSVTALWLLNNHYKKESDRRNPNTPVACLSLFGLAFIFGFLAFVLISDARRGLH
jgi:hypothetical protein